MIRKKTTYFMFCFIVCLLSLTSTSNSLDVEAPSRFLHSAYSTKISMDFKEAQLNDVLKIFSQQSGLNFIAAQDVSNRIVTLYLEDVPVEEALERILNANSLTYEIQPGSDIFIVKPLVRPERNLITRVYSLRHATVSSSKFNRTFSIAEDIGGSGSAVSAVSTGDDSSEGIVAAVEAVLTPDGNLVEDPRTNSLIITDIPPQFPIIEKTIARLDVSIPQILIEVEMLDVSKTVADDIGVRFGSTPITFSGANRRVLYPFNQNEIIREGEFEEFDTSNTAYTTGSVNTSGLAIAFQFLRAHSDTKNLARPKILTLNNETAEIKISVDEAIGSNTNTSGATDVTALQTIEAERTETGVFLTVTPQANVQTGDITLAVEPKVIQARTGGTFNGQTFRDPETRGSKSVLKVHDGDTIILGGLLRDNTKETITKLPILGDIPFLGSAFRHKDKDVDERELIIFITPHIITEDEQFKRTASNYSEIIREQDAPQTHSAEVEKTLLLFERQKL